MGLQWQSFVFSNYFEGSLECLSPVPSSFPSTTTTKSRTFLTLGSWFLIFSLSNGLTLEPKNVGRETVSHISTQLQSEVGG